ncbi:PHB depolymerase family esterase [Actinopolymorpha sp. NPDC004070]|uniref:alpha/beta hydrolase family esterase n=1 Tax=Actinopolymorpha sp. NPDC004070 TaxID=3154548 RepID=UPI0033B037CC
MPSRRRVRLAALVSCVLALATALGGCASLGGHGRDRTAEARVGTPTPGATPASPATSGPPGTRHPGALPRQVRLADGRTYVLPTPAPAPWGARRPLLLVLHSFGGTWQRMEHIGQFQTRAARRGYVVAYGVGARRSWDADGCCGWSNAHHAKDVEYLTDVVADVRHRVPGIDPRRIYLMGFSNGAMMTLHTLCERPHLFAAGVGVAGALVGRCRGGAPIRYLEIHGTSDEVVPYDGGRIDWLHATFPPVSDLPRTIAARAPGSVVEIRSHPCAHVWPVGGRCRLDAATIGWEFLRRYALPSPAHHPARTGR